jgi:uncharacterized membrane protein YfcA
MIASILLGVYGGKWIDNRIGTEKIFTALLALFGVFISIYLVIKDLNRKN